MKLKGKALLLQKPCPVAVNSNSSDDSPRSQLFRTIAKRPENRKIDRINRIDKIKEKAG
jgi:hypothetical protein